jgi:WD40 repeat protein
LGFDIATGTLSGTPTQTGSFPITVTATDQFNQASVAVNFTVVITTHGFAATGSMGTARRFHSATLLGNGKVLIAGGEDAASNAFASAELYDPSTGKFTPTAGSMTVARVGHTATLLNNGKVLITGGATDPSEVASSTAEIYDPTSDKFTATAATMSAARVEHTATLLQSGKVLIAGGDVIFFNGVANSGIRSLVSAEIFDPGTGKFTATAGSMTVPRESHTATLLSSGKVLIAGGSDGTLGNSSPAATTYATSETFDPSTGMFTAAGMMTTQRDYQTANLLSGGKVLVAGGEGNAGAETSADLFDPASGSFAATGHMTEARFYQDASTLADGTVLVTGGSDDSTRAKDSAEVYDPVTATFTGTGSMLYQRVWHTSTVLLNGKVLITGGAGNDSVPVATAELYQ